MTKGDEGLCKVCETGLGYYEESRNFARKNMNSMQRLIMMGVCLVMAMIRVVAQSDTASVMSEMADEDGEIRLSPNFMKELERAFSFDPREEKITPPDDILTREQLHEWVGKPDTSLVLEDGKPKRERFDSTYFALKMYIPEFCKPIPKADNRIFIPGITDHSFSRNLPKHGLQFVFDVNALAPYVRPKEIRKRKLREFANRARPTMDKFLPAEGAPLYTKQDSLDLIGN